MERGVPHKERVSTLYRKFGGAIYARCRRLLKDDALAEDATQEVFVRVLRHIESAPDDATALGWIYRISTNYCLNQIRDRSRQAGPTAPESFPEVEAEAASQGSELSLIDRDTAMKLIHRAPEKLQDVAVLYYLDGLEQDQVATRLGISRRTVINRIQEFVSRSKKFITRDGVT